MRVYQVMNSEPIAVDIEDDVSDAYELMHQHGLERLPVLEDGRLVGVLSEAAIHDGLEPDGGAPGDPDELAIAKLLSHAVESCQPGTSVAEAGASMDAKDVDCIYVTADDGRLLGVVEDTDLVDWYGEGEADAALLEMLPVLRRYAAERASAHATAAH